MISITALCPTTAADLFSASAAGDCCWKNRPSVVAATVAIRFQVAQQVRYGLSPRKLVAGRARPLRRAFAARLATPCRADPIAYTFLQVDRPHHAVSLRISRVGPEAISLAVQQDARASELQYSHEAFDMAPPSGSQPPRVAEPGQESLDDTAALVAAERSAVLRRGPDAVITMRGDQPDAQSRPQLRGERVAVLGAITDRARRVFGEESVPDRRGDERNFMW